MDYTKIMEGCVVYVQDKKFIEPDFGYILLISNTGKIYSPDNPSISCKNDINNKNFYDRNAIFNLFVVNLTFACELYLKSIMMSISENNKFMKTHDLNILFENLGNDKIKDVLQKSFEEKGKKLSDFLEQHKNHFIDFRYAFEE